MTDAARADRTLRWRSPSPAWVVSDLVSLPGPDGTPRDVRILLVDDDAMLLRVLAEVVASRVEGASVETCGSAVEALRRMSERAITTS